MSDIKSASNSAAFVTVQGSGEFGTGYIDQVAMSQAYVLCPKGAEQRITSVQEEMRLALTHLHALSVKRTELEERHGRASRVGRISAHLALRIMDGREYWTRLWLIHVVEDNPDVPLPDITFSPENEEILDESEAN